MGNHSTSHSSNKTRKNVHWKSAGRPAVPGKPEIIPLESDDEPNSITLRWSGPRHDGGAPLLGYQVECNRVGTAGWVRTAPPLVHRPELVLSGLEPPHRYQFRVAAVNAVGPSDHSPLSDVLTVSPHRALQQPPTFSSHLADITALENDKTEFRVEFTGAPSPTIAWFKDGYEIFSSRRTAITTDDTSSILVFHQTLPSDEGEIKCTATNRAGHAVSKAHLSLEAAPKLRYPRQYEDGLLYEINETVYLKTTIVGKPPPSIEWRHDGQPIIQNERIEISNTPKFSLLKIHSAQRSDRGEYQIHARNSIGEDMAAFLVTITAPPDPPRRVSVTRQVDKSVTLVWEPPEDDGGCRIGNYVVEYYRKGWNVWLKATTSRKTSVTLFDLIEGSEYRFRVKAESPYGMSAPSAESSLVKIPGRAVDMEFLAVESRIINDVLLREDGEEAAVSPVPRRRRARPQAEPAGTAACSTAPSVAGQLRRAASESEAGDRSGSNEFMLLLYPEGDQLAQEKAEKRKSFQLDLEEALSPPQLSLSAPDLSTRCTMPFKSLRNSVSSTELLHERAMARFYKAVALEEKQNSIKLKEQQTRIAKPDPIEQKDIPRQPLNNQDTKTSPKNIFIDDDGIKQISITFKPPEIIIKSDSLDNSESNSNSRQVSVDLETSNKWQSVSFEEDYTASTVTTDEEYSDEGSLNEDLERNTTHWNEDNMYNPRDKKIRSSPLHQQDNNESREETIKKTPLPDPNFVPKPILKRRESNHNQNEYPESKPNPVYIGDSKKSLKKDDKMTILKKITKMPGQKPFSFSKILHKKEPEKKTDTIIKNEIVKVTNNGIPKVEDSVSDEGKTVIDYYSNIVKEFGGQKKPSTTLYLKTEDLKTVAEKQQQDKKDKISTKITKPSNIKTNRINKKTPEKSNTNSIKKQTITKQKPEDPEHIKSNRRDSEESTRDKIATQQILLKTTERATIVIPIDYQQLEEKAKVNVRSAIDYMVDLCLLLLAFWVYFFKNEILAIPFLVLIIYRQLQETILLNIPAWIRRHTPSWLKKNS